MCKQKHPHLAALFIVALFFVSCGNRGNNPEKTVLELKPTLIEVSIGGMTCTGCEQTIQAGITKLDGIKSVKASHVTGNAMVEFFPGITDTVKIKEAITGTGYTVKKFKEVQASGSGE